MAHSYHSHSPSRGNVKGFESKGVQAKMYQHPPVDNSEVQVPDSDDEDSWMFACDDILIFSQQGSGSFF